MASLMAEMLFSFILSGFAFISSVYKEFASDLSCFLSYSDSSFFTMLRACELSNILILASALILLKSCKATPASVKVF